MAKYVSIYFDIFYEKLVGSGWPPARSKTNIAKGTTDPGVDCFDQ